MPATPSQYYDVQINGCLGVDFNSDALTFNALLSVCEELQERGVEGFLATIITAPFEKMLERISRLAKFASSEPRIAQRMLGIHVEGPFLNASEGFIGAHPSSAVRSATITDVQRLVDAGDGLVRILTLAPEQDPQAKVVAWLRSNNIVPAAGHTDASRDQLLAAIDEGLQLFTHLGNGCPRVMPRHDNIIQRVLDVSDRIYVSLIADGQHLPDFVFRNFCRCIPLENTIVVSDAIIAAGLGPGKYNIGNAEVVIDETGTPRTPDGNYLAGSATLQDQMDAWLENSLNWPATRRQTVLYDNPKRLLQLA